MEWINTVITLLAVLLGWGLGELTGHFNTKKDRKKKLRRLLYFFLELRYFLANKSRKDKVLEKYLEIFFKKIKHRFGVEKENIGNTNISEFINTMKTFFADESEVKEYDYLVNNIDSAIIELAEYKPILAYELSGPHKVKEKLENVENFLNYYKNDLNEMPFDYEVWLRSKVDANILSPINESITAIAQKIGRKTNSTLKEKLVDFQDENYEDLEKLIDEYLNKIANQF